MEHPQQLMLLCGYAAMFSSYFLCWGVLHSSFFIDYQKCAERAVTSDQVHASLIVSELGVCAEAARDSAASMGALVIFFTLISALVMAASKLSKTAMLQDVLSLSIGVIVVTLAITSAGAATCVAEIDRNVTTMTQFNKRFLPALQSCQEDHANGLLSVVIVSIASPLLAGAIYVFLHNLMTMPPTELVDDVAYGNTTLTAASSMYVCWMLRVAQFYTGAHCAPADEFDTMQYCAERQVLFNLILLGCFGLALFVTAIFAALRARQSGNDSDDEDGDRPLLSLGARGLLSKAVMMIMVLFVLVSFIDSMLILLSANCVKDEIGDKAGQDYAWEMATSHCLSKYEVASKASATFSIAAGLALCLVPCLMCAMRKASQRPPAQPLTDVQLQQIDLLLESSQGQDLESASSESD